MGKSHRGNVLEEFKVEEDWAAERRSLAISLTANRKGGDHIPPVPRWTVSQLLTDGQRHFITECGILANCDTLTILPPITATRWPPFLVPDAAGVQLSVRAERWTVSSLDFLELSIALETDDAELTSAVLENAERAQAALERYVATLGLQPDSTGAKTNQVLALLVAEAARSAG